jgi:hypothetical protein
LVVAAPVALPHEPGVRPPFQPAASAVGIFC